MHNLQTQLRDIEQQVDEEVRRLPILGMPLRVLFAALHLALDGLANGSRLSSSSPANEAKRDSLLSRISYLIDLLGKAPLEPIGAGAANALNFYRQQDPDLTQTVLLLHYAHFCEEMPKVHRGYLQVQSITGSHVILEHATVEFAESEAKDIILSELAGSAILSGLRGLDDAFDKLAAQLPSFDGFQTNLVQTILYRHHQRYVFELDLLDEQGFVAATGVGREVFHRFRAALLALADFCDGLAGALTKLLLADGENEALADELWEWISVFWREVEFRRLIEGLAHTTAAELDKLLPFFMLNLDAARLHVGHAGDGFTPPLVQLGDGILFTASLLRAAVGERNILFGLNRLDRNRFDNLVSQHLEPKLLSDAISLFKAFTTLVVVPNFVWDQGEIDLLVYSPSENAALHVQAKASLPPEGARMVRATETRVQEGIAQLATFRHLPQDRQDSLLSRALSRPVRDVVVADIVLARACFGTHRVWQQASGVTFLTLPLLALAATELAQRGASFSVVGFPVLLDELLRNLLAAATLRWELATMELGSASVAVPMLQYDSRPLLQAKALVYKVFDRYLP